MQRISTVVHIRPDKIEEYKDLHASVWPSVVALLGAANIRNFSIFLREPENLLFGYFEHHGTDLEADLRAMEQHPDMRRWLELTTKCQKPLASAAPGENWSPMREVFHLD